MVCVPGEVALTFPGSVTEDARFVSSGMEAPMIEQHVTLTPSVRAAVDAHYERAANLIAANFPLAPVVPDD